MRIFPVLSFLLIAAFSLHATELEETSITKVASIQAYADYGNGDFTFTVETSGQICKGYWLPKTAAGSATLVALVIAAQKAKSNISVWGRTDASNRWGGASNHFCKVYSVSDAG